MNTRCLSLLLCLSLANFSGAQILQLPTANRALFEKGGGEQFFVGTVGKPWTSGTFGCVRSDGTQMHEGLDIRCLTRDKRGEPTDPVMATADGEVAYINKKPPLSNYGNYIILRHKIDGIEIYSLYAHLSAIAPELKAGQAVKAGQVIGTMGRTTNTKEGISKDRAHVHFELDLFYNDRFALWYKRNFPDQRNDHGNWNGQNLAAIDPQKVLIGQRQSGAKFSIVEMLRSQTPLCRVFVRRTDFPLLRRYAPLVRKNPVAEKEGVVGYEIALNFNGVPCELIPRAASEVKSKSKIALLSVNEAEQNANPCRYLVKQRNGKWQLTDRGLHLIDLITF